jgi:hypothetical protein
VSVFAYLMEKLTSSARVSLDYGRRARRRRLARRPLRLLRLLPPRKPTSKFSQYAASLIEVWIDESERRTGFLTEINRDL